MKILIEDRYLKCSLDCPDNITLAEMLRIFERVLACALLSFHDGDKLVLNRRD